MLSQEAQKQPEMFLPVGQKIDHQVLSHIVEPVCKGDDLLVLADRCFLQSNDSSDHCQHVSAVQRWLQQVLIPRQLQGPGDATAQNLDSFREVTAVLQLSGDFLLQRLLHFLSARPIQIDRVGKIILYRLQLYCVGFFKLYDDILRFIHTKGTGLTKGIARDAPEVRSFEVSASLP